MDDEFINITTENVFNEHLCCIIRSKKFHPGIDAKRQWLSKRFTTIITIVTSHHSIFPHNRWIQMKNIYSKKESQHTQRKISSLH